VRRRGGALELLVLVRAVGELWPPDGVRQVGFLRLPCRVNVVVLCVVVATVPATAPRRGGWVKEEAGPTLSYRLSPLPTLSSSPLWGG
jgi:hypothetical protein